MRLSVQTLKDYLLERQIRPPLPDQERCEIHNSQYLSTEEAIAEMHLDLKFIASRSSGE